MRVLAAAAFTILSTTALAQVTETVQLTITGGPNAGKHEATADRGGCSAGLTGAGSFGNQLSNPKDKDPKKFNSLQLILPDAKKSDNFLIVVGFGPLMSRSATYTVDTRSDSRMKGGSGKVTVDDKGATATVTFAATTADGVKMEGTIDCKNVTRGK
ncbi:hypothetical protein BWI17_07110 [Betaproteobacteria bacterium GR16-43]|nr:hypothetical protein BWI17_07110 [Betaproteobacteria bacterium GR16-43]